jgi:hypothetical protein
MSAAAPIIHVLGTLASAYGKRKIKQILFKKLRKRHPGVLKTSSSTLRNINRIRGLARRY